LAIPVDYSGASSTTKCRNGIYFVVFSNAVISAAASLDITGSARLTFTDS